MNEKTLGILVSVGTLVTVTIATLTWGGDVIDPLFATETEVKQMISQTQFATKGDLNHFSNMMVEEQIADAQEELWQIEDLEDLGQASAADLRKKQRLKQAIEDAKKKCLPEEGATHHHKGC